MIVKIDVKKNEVNKFSNGIELIDIDELIKLYDNVKYIYFHPQDYSWIRMQQRDKLDLITVNEENIHQNTIVDKMTGLSGLQLAKYNNIIFVSSQMLNLHHISIKQVINLFAGKYRFLSNFFIVDVFYNGRRYVSSEHAYQAAKADNPVLHNHIADLQTAGAAKRAGGTIDVREGWHEDKLDIMMELVETKFRQNKDLMDLLIETGDAELIEGNNHNDTFWGTCDGLGSNYLGRILMNVRTREMIRRKCK